MGGGTVGFFVLLVLSHGFEACGTGEKFVGEVALVVGLIRLRAILAVDVLVGLRGVVCGLCELRSGIGGGGIMALPQNMV